MISQDSNDLEQRPLLYIDGELNILKEVFDEAVMRTIQDANLDMMKGPPSATHIHQAWDCGCLFRNLKKGVQQVSSSETVFLNATLDRNIRTFMNEFKAEFKGVPMTAAHVDKISHCLQVISYSAKSNWTANKMTNSFVGIGQHTLGAKAAGETTVDYDLIMARSYCNHVTEDELNHMREQLPVAVQYFQENGECFCYLCVSVAHSGHPNLVLHAGRLTNEFLDSIEVMRLPEAKDRDQLVLSQRDVEVLTHASTIASMREYLEQLHQRNDPAAREEQKQITAAQRLVKAAEKKAAQDQKRAEELAAKKKAEADEAARVLTLTPQQQQLEKKRKTDEVAANREAKKAKKQERDDAKAAKVQSAKAVLAAKGMTAPQG
jgi:hypothetical protein